MKISAFLSENVQFLLVKFSIYLNKRVFECLSSRSYDVAIILWNTSCHINDITASYMTLDYRRIPSSRRP